MKDNRDKLIDDINSVQEVSIEEEYLWRKKY